MATSVVAICNLALQKLAANQIASLEDNTPAARAVNLCYEHLRDTELSTNYWNFAKKRAVLAPSAVIPEFDYDLAFPLPSDFLALIPEGVQGSDWAIENNDEIPSILTNEGDTLNIRYIAQITDPNRYDPAFIEMLACRIAVQICEVVTGSTSKQQLIMQQYDAAKKEAKKRNAFVNIPIAFPEDQWLVARR